MKQYLKRFWILYAVLLVMLFAYLVGYFVNKKTENTHTRTNTECLTDERVFDYADKLTDEEAASLRELIAEREAQIGCDIVLLIMDEPVGSDMYDLRDYADDFYDDHKFGYDEPWGDGVIYVDNWYSYGDYNGDVWFGTSGRAEDRYSSSMIDDLIDHACAVVNNDPYKAYCRVVNDVYADMSGHGSKIQLQPFVILIFAVIVTFFYLSANLAAHKGKKTTTAHTYVAGGVPVLNDSDDVFVTKHLTSRRIESSSGSGGGGGGHHVSGGGHSHGGGGGHH